MRIVKKGSVNWRWREDSWITLEHSENDSQEEEDNIIGREVPWFRSCGYNNWMYTIQKCSIPLTPRDIHRRINQINKHAA